MFLEGQVGPPPSGVGVNLRAPIRLGAGADLIVSELQGRYGELCFRGQLFSFGVTQATYAATSNSPLTANTGVPMIGVFNPVNSGKLLMILQVCISTTSGAPGGPFYWNVIPNPAGITAAGSTPVSNLTSNAAGSVAKAFGNAAITGSATGVLLRPIGGPTSVTSAAGIDSVFEDTAGSIIVQQGGFAGIAGTAVGTTHVFAAGMTWAELTL